MRLNHDLIRNILLLVESLDYQQKIVIENNLENPYLQAYSEDEILYHVEYLSDDGLIDTPAFADGVTVISDLTPYGHNFLENIRNDNNWSRIKKIAEYLGTKSMDALVQIASNVITELIRHKFRLM